MQVSAFWKELAFLVLKMKLHSIPIATRSTIMSALSVHSDIFSILMENVPRLIQTVLRSIRKMATAWVVIQGLLCSLENATEKQSKPSIQTVTSLTPTISAWSVHQDTFSVLEFAQRLMTHASHSTLRRTFVQLVIQATLWTHHLNASNKPQKRTKTLFALNGIQLYAWSVQKVVFSTNLGYACFKTPTVKVTTQQQAFAKSVTQGILCRMVSASLKQWKMSPIQIVTLSVQVGLVQNVQQVTTLMSLKFVWKLMTLARRSVWPTSDAWTVTQATNWAHQATVLRSSSQLLTSTVLSGMIASAWNVASELSSMPKDFALLSTLNAGSTTQSQNHARLVTQATNLCQTPALASSLLLHL